MHSPLNASRSITKLINMTHFRRFSTYLVGVLALATGLACGSKSEGKADSASDLKVALLTPGPISDQSWNGGAYQGLMWIRDSLDAKVSHIQTRTPAEFDENFRQYG